MQAIGEPFDEIFQPTCVTSFDHCDRNKYVTTWAKPWPWGSLTRTHSCSLSASTYILKQHMSSKFWASIDPWSQHMHVWLLCSRLIPWDSTYSTWYHIHVLSSLVDASENQIAVPSTFRTPQDIHLWRMRAVDKCHMEHDPQHHHEHESARMGQPGSSRQFGISLLARNLKTTMIGRNEGMCLFPHLPNDTVHKQRMPKIGIGTFCSLNPVVITDRPNHKRHFRLMQVPRKESLHRLIAGDTHGICASKRLGEDIPLLHFLCAYVNHSFVMVAHPPFISTIK